MTIDETVLLAHRVPPGQQAFDRARSVSHIYRHYFPPLDPTCYPRSLRFDSKAILPYPTAPMASAESDDLERFQRLSDQYQADLPGPLIGQMLPISVVITEYAHADPTYRMKTAALSGTYSHYRPVKGDGQCGWRAAVFGYLEQLLQQGSPDKILGEITRLKSFNESLPMVGFDLSMVELFQDSALELMEKMYAAAQSRNLDKTLLLETMNNEEESNSIVYYFKILTSTFMQFNANQYEPFLEVTVQEYCKSRIEAHAQEIEQAGLQALTDGILAPAGIAVEVLYLDRSHGDEVTPHMFVQNAEGWPTVRLLYRPGHYDMIYKAEQAFRVQLARQPDHTSTFLATDYNDYYHAEPMSTLFPDPSTKMGSGTSAGPSYSIAPDFFPISEPGRSQGMAYPSHFERYYEPFYNTSNHASPTTLTQSYREASVPQAASPSVGLPTASDSPASPPEQQPQPQQHGEIRLSQQYYDYNQGHHEAVPLETGPFRNSPFNQAHFQNEKFQPLLWKAEEEYGKS